MLSSTEPVDSSRPLLAGLVGLALLGFAACSEQSSDPTLQPDPGALPEYYPEPGALRRLLARQYVNSVREIFGDGAAAAARPPRDDELNGFMSIAAAQQALTDELVADYERSALAVAAAAMGDADRIAQLMACDPAVAGDAACHRAFLEHAGRLVFRRPMTEAEVTDYLDVAAMGMSQMSDFYAGIRYSIAALLQSPHFIYQVAVGEPDPVRVNVNVIKGHEMAARLSFFLHDGTPSDALLAAAEAGALDTSEGVATMAREMLAQPHARRALSGFFDEYFVLANLGEVAKDPSLFPTYSSELAESMRLETLKLIEDIVFVRDAPITELFTADYTFVDHNLASHYGVTPPADDVAWTRAALPTEQRRGGILTHSSILTKQAHATSTSATYRGLFILERFFCRSMPPPPPNVDPTLPPSSQAPTLRDRIKVHQEDMSCRTCHYEVDSMGLALENFDAIGKYRDKENGALIDAKVELEGVGSFDGARELGALLAQKPDVMACVLRNVFRHATGHVEVSGERAGLEVLDARVAASGYRFKDLLVTLVSSDAFRTVGVRE